MAAGTRFTFCWLSCPALCCKALPTAALERRLKIAPQWSPDGSKLVFVSARDGNNEIYSMNNAGTEQVRLTSNSADDSAVRWSPDGSQLLYVSSRDGNTEIYSMLANGNSQTNLSRNSSADVEPVWQLK